MIRSVRLTAALAVGVVAATALATLPAASADFTLAPCAGSSITGRGSSFQVSAHAAWTGTAGFKSSVPPGCGPATISISYQSDGSAAGRRALGERSGTNPTGDRDTAVRFGASDDAPTDTQRAQIESGAVTSGGADANAADNDKVHVIPVTAGAIAVVANWPRDPGTSVLCDFGGLATLNGRPEITAAVVEKMFSGADTTWGQVMTDLGKTFANSNCASVPVRRVVRLDDSGSTTALKQWLQKVNPATPWSALANQAWPGDSGGSAVSRPVSSGAAALRDVVVSNVFAGSISYLDLATARHQSNPTAAAPADSFTYAGAGDGTFWLPVQEGTGTTYDDPSIGTGYGGAAGATRGANCANITPSNVPPDTFGNWSQVNSTRTSGGYGICTLTYVLAFDDDAVVYCNSAAEQAMARTVKDYLASVLTDSAQNAAQTADYSLLPADIKAKATAGVNAIGWAKTGGRSCSAPTPPAAPSNAFSTGKATASHTKLRLTAQLPGPGTLAVKAKAKRRHRTVVVGATTVPVAAGGAKSVTLKLTKVGRRLHHVRATVTLTFTPTGGTPATRTLTVRLK